MKQTLFTLYLFLSLITFSQKKKIDYTAYDDWKAINNVRQSENGQLIVYEINPQVGDGILHIQTIDEQIKKTFNRGKNALISRNGNAVIFKIAPQTDTIRKLKLDKAKKETFPKDSLAIYWPSKDSICFFKELKSYEIGKKSDWLIYQSTVDERPLCANKKRCKKRKRKGCKRTKTSGTTLHLINLLSGETKNIHAVTKYHLSENGNQLTYIISSIGEKDSLSIHHVDLNTLTTYPLLQQQLSIDKIATDQSGTQLAFLHSCDTNKLKSYKLSYWKIGSPHQSLAPLIDSTTKGMPAGENISIYQKPYFSANGKLLYVGTAKIVQQEPEDTLLESEKSVLDIWGSFEPRIQPRQHFYKKEDETHTHTSVYHFETNQFVPLGNQKIDKVITVDKGNANFGIGINEKPYLLERTWSAPWRKDVYLLNIETGAHEMIKKSSYFSFSLSPSTDQFVWYEATDSNWYAKNTLTKDSVNLTESIDAIFTHDHNGHITISHSKGNAGWALIDSIEYFLVNAKYDIWALCPSNPSASFSLTNKMGKQKKEILRITNFEPDSTYRKINDNLIQAVNDETKSESIYRITLDKEKPVLTELINSNHTFTRIKKSKNRAHYIFSRENFAEFADLEICDSNFTDIKKITKANPQQNDYNWGTVDMVTWNTFDSLELRGMLFKPEDFDSTKSYPMIVYFYERLTPSLHHYYAPKPTRSIIYPTEYASNGYIIFIPDIEYVPGHPANSAYNCIVSGTDYLTQKYNWIDTTRLGLQGQSWGGYQTAQLITMTTKYKAAMAGAPVSNMFSAYGGVRWGSGLSRMFQYEHAQSRIGHTIWEKPELYIENSPLFALDKVKTPLLIMHNDNDGAVPWYQGIELYMGLRRLQQPAWLLNYNGEQHNLVQRANCIDLSRRMRQFFDYYLLDSAIPVWMEDGVPAIRKGKDWGLELKKND